MKRFVVIGDSITSGVGSRKNNYVNFLNEKSTDIEFENLGESGATSEVAFQIAKKINTPFDGAIIFIGNVDAKHYPNFKIEFKGKKFVPKRYLVGEYGQLEIRPYYSQNFFRKTIQKIGNAVRMHYRKKIYKRAGLFQPVNIQDFSEYYSKIINVLKEKGIKEIYCLSTVYIKEGSYYSSYIEYEKYNQAIKKCCIEQSGVYVDIYKKLKETVESNKNYSLKANESMSGYYFLDGFHPNEKGLEIIANEIIELINNFNFAYRK